MPEKTISSNTPLTEAEQDSVDLLLSAVFRAPELHVGKAALNGEEFLVLCAICAESEQEIASVPVAFIPTNKQLTDMKVEWGTAASGDEAKAMFEKMFNKGSNH